MLSVVLMNRYLNVEVEEHFVQNVGDRLQARQFELQARHKLDVGVGED